MDHRNSYPAMLQLGVNTLLQLLCRFKQTFQLGGVNWRKIVAIFLLSLLSRSRHLSLTLSLYPPPTTGNFSGTSYSRVLTKPDAKIFQSILKPYFSTSQYDNPPLQALLWVNGLSIVEFECFPGNRWRLVTWWHELCN